MSPGSSAPYHLAATTQLPLHLHNFCNTNSNQAYDISLERSNQLLQHFQISKIDEESTSRGDGANLRSSSGNDSRPLQLLTLVTFKPQLQFEQTRSLWKRNFTRNKPSNFH